MRNSVKTTFYKATLKDLLFPVEMISATANGCYDESNSDCAYDIVATIDGKKRKLQSCSDIYTLTPNSEIYPQIEQLFAAVGIPFDAMYNHINYSKFYGQYSLLGESFNVNGKRLSIIINVVHSYDGWLNYSFFAGLVGELDSDIRKSIPVVNQDFFKGGKHTKKSLDSVQELYSAVGKIIEQKDEIKKALETLVTTKVERPSELVESIMKKVGLNDGRGKEGKNKTAVMQRAQFAKSHWDIYTAFNEGYVYNNEVNKLLPHKRAELDLDIMNLLLN